ncbi:hypothetical protein EEL33_12440 [Muribaculaceae bacterium Isolate-037 (Harlan)]|jgi:hypothetical protein|nr:hypothetical protein EEL33_12440 [Muribaculaceae bacterium Isolate-037 (Harlan)]TKC56087.1 hypothetical protein E5359_013690 [Bacteroidales bacterium]
MKKVLIFILSLVMASVVYADDWQTQKGYRGFADLGGVIGMGSHGENALTISTTHGYQVVPSYLFVGAGIGFNTSSVLLPMYLNLRTQLPTGKWSPFLDFRAGYSGKLEWDFNDGGALFNPSVGVTWSVAKRFGLELSVGYIYQRATTSKVESGRYVNGKLEISTENRERHNIGGINIRCGFTF